MKTSTIIFIFLALNLSITACAPSRVKTSQLLPSKNENSNSRLLAGEERDLPITFSGEDLLSLTKDLDVSAEEFIAEESIISEEEFFWRELEDLENHIPEIREEHSRNLAMIGEPRNSKENFGDFRRSN